MVGGFQVVCHTLVIDRGNIAIYILIENPICLLHCSTGSVVTQLEILLVDWNE